MSPQLRPCWSCIILYMCTYSYLRVCVCVFYVFWFILRRREESVNHNNSSNNKGHSEAIHSFKVLCTWEQRAHYHSNSFTAQIAFLYNTNLQLDESHWLSFCSFQWEINCSHLYNGHPHWLQFFRTRAAIVTTSWWATAYTVANWLNV